MGNETLGSSDQAQPEQPPIWSSQIDLRYDIHLRPAAETGFHLHIIDSVSQTEVHRQPMELAHGIEQGLHIQDVIEAKKQCLRHIDKHGL